MQTAFKFENRHFLIFSRAASVRCAPLRMEFDINYSEKQPLLGGTSEPNKNTQVQRSGNAAVYSRRKSSTAKLAVERPVRTRERLWATAISASVAAIPTLLVGYTLGYPSSAIPQLQALPPGRQFSDLLAALFGVSGIVIIAMNALVTINWRQTKTHKSTKKLYAGVVPRPNPLTRKGSGLVCLQPDITYKNLLVTFLGFCTSAAFECAADYIWKFSPQHGFNWVIPCSPTPVSPTPISPTLDQKVAFRLL